MKKTRMIIKRFIVSAAPLLCAWLCCFQMAAHAGLLNRQEVDKLLEGQYIVGEVQADMPVHPLYEKNPAAVNGKPALIGYAFESIDFEPVRGYSGKPIDLLIAMDMAGGFMDIRLIEHKEPFFNNPTGTRKLADFSAQYIDLSLRHNIHVNDHRTLSSRDDQSAQLQGVNHGTVTVKAIDRSVIASASKVAIARLSADVAHGAAASAARRRTSSESYDVLAWDTLRSRGMISSTTLTRTAIDNAFTGTLSFGADKLASTRPEDTALLLHTALISMPSIGRSLLDSEGWRFLGTSRRQSHALLIIERGPLAHETSQALRVTDELPFELKQHGKTIKLQRLAYDKGLNVPGYPAQANAYFLIAEKTTPLDPAAPFELSFRLARRFATNQILNQAETRHFAIAHDFYGWRATALNFLAINWSGLDWVKVWRSRLPEIVTLLAGLLVLSIGLIAQKWLAASPRRLRLFRLAYLSFTLGFIGWYAQGQLTILNITAALSSLTDGGDLGFLLNDPMTVILWIFVLGTLLVWGRSTFCGWLCPFGALQELISVITNAIGVQQRRLRTALDAKLKWLKYAVLATIVGSVFVAPSFAELAVKVEPFETAISFFFLNDWPYVVWALLCLGAGVLVYRGYCRYLCPLGAALAAVNVLQRWSWIPRRSECGTPCQTCRHRCEYQAISAQGKINYSECFQCLDCVAIYQDDHHCLPLIQQRRDMMRVVPIKSIDISRGA
jgi:NosR/NirI family nitrous oxide reductase transcriptional regulator